MVVKKLYKGFTSPSKIPDYIYRKVQLPVKESIYRFKERRIFPQRDLDSIFAEAASVDDLKSQKYVMLHLLGDLKAVENVPGDVLEVGSFKGKTSVFLAESIKKLDLDKQLVTVDPHTEDSIEKGCKNEDPASAYEIFDDATSDLVRHEHYSLPSDEAVQELRDRQFSLIFVDGDHSYDGVRTDYDQLYPLLSEGGLMVFDDYRNRGAWPGVGRAVDEIIAERKLSVDRRMKKTIHFKKDNNKN